MRPYKLRRFAGDSGTDADDFIWEAKLVLQLQPMGDCELAPPSVGRLGPTGGPPAASGGGQHPRETICALELNWGEQRDTSMLAAVFYEHQQGLTELVGDYAVALQALWAKANAAPGTLSVSMLRDAFSNGLDPASLKRDIKRFIRERPESTFTAAKTEALRWMREDSNTDATSEQLTSVNNAVLTRMEAQLSALTTETTSLKQQLQGQRRHASQPSQAPRGNQRGLSAGNHRNGGFGGRHNRHPTVECCWCRRPGHNEGECYAKQRYQQRTGAAPQPPQQQAGNY